MVKIRDKFVMTLAVEIDAKDENEAEDKFQETIKDIPVGVQLSLKG